MGLFLPVNAAQADLATIFGTTEGGPRYMVFDQAGNLYVANYDSNNVSKITPAGVSTILGTTGDNPRGIAIDQSGNIYTSNFGSNNVSKITPGGDSTIYGTTGAGPLSLAFDGIGNLYTANRDSNNVSKITPEGVSTILGTTGSQPYGIAVDASGNVYTTNSASNNVSKITQAGNSTIFANVGTAPNHLVFDSLGNLYVANFVSANVSKITPAGVSTILGTTGIGPYAIALDSSGNVYTTNNNNNKVSKITPAGISRFISKTTGSAPTGIAIDSLGNIYIANRNDKTVSKITAAEANILEPQRVEGALFATREEQSSALMVQDSAGNFYIPNYDSDNVSKITPAGVSTILGTTGDGPAGIALDSLGNIYTANQRDNTVSKITPAGVSTEHFGNTGNRPTNLVLDKAGNIYVANFFGTNPNDPNEHGISKITSAGVSTINFVSTGDSTQLTNIAIDQANNLYVTNCGAWWDGGIGDVRKITPAGVVTTLATTGKCPNSLVFDAAGNIYTSNWELNSVSKITPAGVSTPDWGQIEGPLAKGLAIDPLGNIYTANSTAHSISKITPEGVSTILGTTGPGGEPVGIVYSSGSIYTANSNGTVYKFPLTTTTAGTAPNSQVATISSGVTGVIIPSTAALPATTLKFGGAVPTAVTVVPVATNPAPASATPFTISGSTKIVDIQITGTFNGSATVCLDGNSTDHLFHYVGGKWEELPSRTYNSVTGQVCGVTTSFSPFAAAEPAPILTLPGLVPTFSAASSLDYRFTVKVANFDSAYTYSVSASPGTATISSTGLVTVTNLGLDASTTVTVTTTRAGYESASASIGGRSQVAAMVPSDKPVVTTTATSIMCTMGVYSAKPTSAAFSLFVDGKHVSTSFSATGEYLPDWIIPWATSSTITRTASLTSASWTMSDAYKGKSVTCTTLAYSKNAIGFTSSKAITAL